MLHMPTAALCVAALLPATLGGCISPLQDMESDLEVERSIQAKWNAPTVEAWVDDVPWERASDAPDAELPEIGEASSLEQCLTWAAVHNPRLEASFHRWQAAVQRVPQVTALPDPRFSFAYYIVEVQTRTGPQQQRLGASQTFPWFGKLDLAGDAAAEAADAERERLQTATLALFNRISATWAEMYYLARAIDITRDNVTLLGQFERVALARYKVATATQPDVIRIQVELGRLRDRLAEFEDLRRPWQARLNETLGRDANEPVPWPTELPEPLASLDEAKLATLVLTRNPELLALEHEARGYRHSAELAHKAAWPDITLGVDYIITGSALDPATPDSGDDPILAGISLNVPVWRDKYEAGAREALRHRLATASTRADTANRLRAQLASAAQLYRDGQRRLALYRDELVPKARESLEASLRGYQAGTTTFLDLLDAERVLLELELSEHRARADALMGLARVRMLTGGALDGESS